MSEHISHKSIKRRVTLNKQEKDNRILNGLKVSVVIVSIAALVTLAACSQQVSKQQASIPGYFQEAIEAPSRSPKYVQRDVYRHPIETLNFFNIKPTDTVVEIWPGDGWYSEVLAPLLQSQGQLIAAHFPEQSQIKYYERSRAKFNKKMQQPAYNKVQVSSFHPPKQLNIAKAGSADKVLTFRNVHNWMKSGAEQAAFKAFFTVLTPGGYLGVVEHRAHEGTSLTQQIKSGYVTESYVKQLAQEAGFMFVASSEVNANIKDTKNYPNGVWSLPPSLRIADENKAAQLAIGESDRMTLLFKKP